MSRWQEEKLLRLSKKSYAELSRLPAQTYIRKPREFDRRMFIQRKHLSKGRIEISVRYEFPPDPPDYGGDDQFVSASIGPHFEMDRDGTVTWPVFVHDPRD